MPSKFSVQWGRSTKRKNSVLHVRTASGLPFCGALGSSIETALTLANHLRPEDHHGERSCTRCSTKLALLVSSGATSVPVGPRSEKTK